MTERNNACAMTEESAMERVNYYIHKIAENSFAGTRTGAVLDDVLGSSGKMIRPRLLLLCSALDHMLWSGPKGSACWQRW